MELLNNFKFYCNIICTFVTNLIRALKGNIKNVYNNQIIYCFLIIIIIIIIIIIMTFISTQQGVVYKKTAINKSFKF